MNEIILGVVYLSSLISKVYKVIIVILRCFKLYRYNMFWLSSVRKML